ncbi:hypothetical protein PFICI_01978 [Pestalotiopsis fici W106-1]|uniref:Zn(2)-C6 fungal-type domain-containing protein n=1 Tax=Pestalotiopsis fici (strain W106-1 / CGMCC3.15140) TaxID=1229662 RepID=W3XQA6_PESFW|nr:uncharacterized protein PFICI_01978 [Pestalotiopsis fici W106-1]ETS88150.1 hypothetical protein PFICI_01978 [Pestalotiopsis fici W106-1]
MPTEETAIANGGHSRRVACKLCRDRKVKCGGEQPQCQKCVRAGEQCVYVPVQRPTKADLAQTVESLQKRLDEAEAYIARLTTSPGDDVTPPSSHTSNVYMNSGALAPAYSTVPTPSAVHLGGRDVDAPVNPSRETDLLYQEQDLHPADQDLSDPPMWPTLEEHAQFEANGEHMNIDPVGLDFYVSNANVTDYHKNISEETGTAILGPVVAFSSAVLRNQAEASVMGSLIADYIDWLRKVPPGGGGSVNQGPHYVGILETLETRVRELCDTSQSRSSSALSELITALKGVAPPDGALAARLDGLEDELQKEACERAEFFRSRYNICALLTEQARNIS